MICITRQFEGRYETDDCDRITEVEKVRLQLQIDFLYQFSYVARHFGIVTRLASSHSIGSIADGSDVVSIFRQ